MRSASALKEDEQLAISRDLHQRAKMKLWIKVKAFQVGGVDYVTNHFS